MDRELLQLLVVARRWWWLLLIAPLIGGVAAYGLVSRDTPSYQASATLLIYPAQDSGAPDFNAIQNIDGLVETYRQLATTRPVLEPVVRDLHLPYGVDELESKVTASASRGALLLTVTAADPDPGQAAAIANAVAASFTTVVHNQIAQIGQSSRQALQRQIGEIQHQIDVVTGQIQTLAQSPNASEPQIQAQLDTQRTNLASLEQTYATLSTTAQQIDLDAAASQTQVSVFENAPAPTAPEGPRSTLSILLGAFAGILIAGGLIALLEYVDTTVKPDTDVSSLVGADLLGVIGRVPRMWRRQGKLFVLEYPNTAAADAIRLLRTNLEFAAEIDDITSLAICSPDFGDGKSVVAANLAVAMAQTGRSVVIIDANLRRPSQHRIFEVRNDKGLTTLLTEPDQPWDSAAVEVVMPNLRLIPGGPLPRQPADLLNSSDLRRLLSEIARVTDIILVDTSPIRSGSDPLLVAANVDGVVLVCRAGRTRVAALRGAVAAFRHGTIRLVGVVLNRQPGRAMDSYFHGAGNPRPTASANGLALAARSATFPMNGDGHNGAKRRPPRRRSAIKARSRPNDAGQE